MDDRPLLAQYFDGFILAPRQIADGAQYIVDVEVVSPTDWRVLGERHRGVGATVEEAARRAFGRARRAVRARRRE